MRAIILAAGLGKRMLPLTASVHKTLLKIGGRSILGRIVDALIANDIHDLTIVTGYRAQELHEFMAQEFPKVKVQWVHNDKYETTNNIYSLSLALEQSVSEDTILIESDLVFDQSIITKLLQSHYDATALVSLYEAGMDGTVVSLSRDIISAIHPPHLQGDDFVFRDKYKTLNIYKFSKRFLDQSLRKLTSFYAKSVNDNCYYELVLGVMIYMQSCEINAAVVDTSLWAEIDDPIDMQATEFKFNPEKRIQTLDTTHGAYWNYPIHDFCYVQNAYFPTEGILSLLRHHLPLVIKSYGLSQTELDRKMSYFVECDENNILSLNGSSQIFPWLREYVAGQKVLLPKPTFGEYTRVLTERVSYYDDNAGMNLKQIKDMIAVNDVIVFVNPNNPTGSILQTQALQEMISRHTNKLFVVDESFIDFANEPSLIDFLKTHKDCKNVLLLKSLGKALGVPGLRLGFVYSNDRIILEKIRYTLPVWNTNSLAEYFLELLLKNRRNLNESFQLVKKSRLSLGEKLQEIPFIETVFPSQANFLLTKVNSDLIPKQGLAQALLEEYSIYIKDVSAKFETKSQYFRFAVRKAESNEMLLQALLEMSRQTSLSRVRQ